MTWGFVGLGIVLRTASYALGFPLWWDEAFVAANLLRRDYLELLGPLDYGQVGPLLFLWGELTAVRWLGFSEWSLRLLPLLASIASVVLFRWMAGQVLRGQALLLAVAVFAVSVHPIKHAADVKPYALDTLASLILLIPAVLWANRPDRSRPLWILAAVAPFSLLLSHPALFVIAGIGLAIAIPAWRTGKSDVRSAFLAVALVVFATYVGLYVGFTQSQASSASPGMSEMWWRSFPPRDSVEGVVRWLAVVHSGEMLSYPCGGEGGKSFVSLFLALGGVVVLWRQGRRVAVGCLLGALGVALIAAAFRKYPYGGPAPHGSAARIMQYAAPALCLMIGQGGSSLLDRIRDPGFSRRALRITLMVLVVVGVVPIASGYVHPYRAYQAQAAREFARQFWPRVGQGAEVACLRWDWNVGEWNSVRLGIPVMLCNQAIASPSRLQGAPDWSKISQERPLRCVLGVAGPADQAAVEAWLITMNARFTLRSRQKLECVISEPGRPRVVENYEVYEFEPNVVEIPRGTSQTMPTLALPGFLGYNFY